MTKDISKLI